MKTVLVYALFAVTSANAYDYYGPQYWRPPYRWGGYQSPPPPPPPPPSPPPPPVVVTKPDIELTSSDDIDTNWDLNQVQYQRKFQCLVNKERAKYGLKQVMLTSRLNTLAAEFAKLDSPRGNSDDNGDGVFADPETPAGRDQTTSQLETRLRTEVPFVSSMKHLETNFCLTLEDCFQDFATTGKIAYLLRNDFTRMGVGAYTADDDNHVGLVLVADGSHPKRAIVDASC